ADGLSAAAAGAEGRAAAGGLSGARPVFPCRSGQRQVDAVAPLVANEIGTLRPTGFSEAEPLEQAPRSGIARIDTGGKRGPHRGHEGVVDEGDGGLGGEAAGPNVRMENKAELRQARGAQLDHTNRLCTTAASMKLANSGCGSKGLDLSSGWNCTPMNQGWSVRSTISGSRPSGETPENRRPFFSSSLR